MREKNPWFDYALDDFRATDSLANEGVYRLACFHAQQFLEKVFKGLLYQQGIDPPRTHDLALLYRKFSHLNITLTVEMEDLEFLSGVYLESRYPPDLGLLPSGAPTQEDAEEALSIAKKVYVQIKEMLE